MKSTQHFKQTISNYLGEIASHDALFAKTFKKGNKNIDDCITYILNTVQKSGCNGFSDDEIYSMAVHYYDESTIDIGDPVNCNVVVNHTIKLTEEEEIEARKKAISNYQNSIYEDIRNKNAKKNKNKTEVINQPSLF